MTASELADIIDRHRLTQAAASKLLGTRPRSLRNYITGTRKIPESIAILARMIDRKKPK